MIVNLYMLQCKIISICGGCLYEAEVYTNTKIYKEYICNVNIGWMLNCQTGGASTIVSKSQI